MRWSVALEAIGDREMEHEEIVELADAVAPSGGVASGIGATAYGARLLVSAEDRDGALATAKDVFAAAVQRAGLPAWPVREVEVVSELDDGEDDLIGGFGAPT